jgi:hypothetical protein
VKQMFLDGSVSSLHTAMNCNYSVCLAGRRKTLKG